MKLDLMVLAVIFLFVLGGIRLGAMGSLMKFLSFFGSALVSLFLFPVLQKTQGYQTAIKKIEEILIRQGVTVFPDRAASIIASILLILILYFGGKLLLLLLSTVLEGVVQLPLLKQANRLTGALLGALEAGVLILGFLAVVRLVATPDMEINQWIGDSVLTKALYEYNPLITLFAGKRGK